ncbi:MAG TPA: ChrR family anti-sigma-E factor [Dokdonella sp.]|nr:ChrR family anti-sigma-E factor [Dokdonella sp.]
MTPRHHLDEATVVSYATGALSPEMAAVAATHLELCSHCRAVLASAERVGGALLGQQKPQPTGAERERQLRDAMAERLSAAPAHGGFVRDTPEPPADPDGLPRPLHAFFGPSWRALKWRWMGPGVQMIRSAKSSGDTLILLRIGPGKGMPVHSHGSTELTQILRGAYEDELGHFSAGDVADLGPDVTHRPVTSPGGPCICVAALDAPLRFPGWLARMVQPLVGL